MNYFSNFGAGKPTLWIHGLLGNSLNLSSLAKGVEGNHYLLDARNHGRSFHAPGMSYDILSQDILRFMDAQKIEKASVVGHSMGGKTAMFASCSAPERFEKVCVLDVAPVSYKNLMTIHYAELRSYLEYMKQMNLENKTRKELENEIQRHFNEPNITALLSSNMRLDKLNYYSWRVGLDNLLAGLDQIGDWIKPDHKFNGPALIIVGENSKHTAKFPLLTDSVKLIDLYTPYLPNAKVEILPQAGHFIHADKPREVLRLIKEFLE